MPTFSVVMCAYTLERWADLIAAVEAVQGQTLPARELILVIDHNRDLWHLCQQSFPNITLLENTGARGLSGSRNTGIAAASGDVIAFIDEDAVAAPTWLERLSEAYNDERVLGVG